MKVVNTILNIIEIIAVVLLFLAFIGVVPKAKAVKPVQCNCPCCIKQVQKAPEVKKSEAKQEKKAEAKHAKKTDKKDAKVGQSKGIDPRYDHKPGMAPTKKQEKAPETVSKK